MNKKAEEAGGEAWSKIIKIILVIAVLFLVLWALIFGDIPGWLNNLIPDFLKTHTDNSALKLEQANIPEMQKSLDCPSKYRAITLIYKGGKNDFFQVRYNEGLAIPRVQVYIWPNYYANDLMISAYNTFLGKEKSRKDSKEWLIYSDDKLNGVYDGEFRELNTILQADTKEIFIAAIVDILRKDKNLYIDLGNGEISKDQLVTEQNIINFLNDPGYLQKYDEDLKKASLKCNGKLEDNLKTLKDEQTKILERLKNLKCPSPDRSIFLMYNNFYKLGWDDLFELRFNSELKKPQIKMWINFAFYNHLYHITQKDPPQIYPNQDVFTKEWLIDPDLFESFNKNKDFKLYEEEIEKIRHVMYSQTEDEFIQRISELSQETEWDISWDRYYGTLSTDKMTEKEILDGLNDKKYFKQFEEDSKKASTECKQPVTLPATKP
jgi:hypothetical protein